jgi:hypothetical protein
MKSSRSIKFTPWAVYNYATLAFYNDALYRFAFTSMERLLISEFKSTLEIITKYMLEGRFETPEPSKKKKKNPLKLRGPAKKQHSVAFLAYFDKLPPIKQKQSPLVPSDIVKFYKSMEVFILRRKWIIDIEELKLGNFELEAKRLVELLPKLLLVVESQASISKAALDLIFSMVVIYRQFKVGSKPDLESVAAPYSGSSLEELAENEFSDQNIIEWLESLRILDSTIGKTLKLSIYSGNASSPNSGASATKLIEDAHAVKLDEKLKDSIIGMAKEFSNGQHFVYLAEVLFANIWDMKDTIHSRLFHFTAKGGKARIIANVDWMSQTALSALHFWMYKLLATIKSDFTFDHKEGLNYIWNKRQPLDSFYSIDLSAATDRMPRYLQSLILRNLCSKIGLDGTAIAKHWLNIMDRSFSTKGTALNNDKPIVYSVGQGMGIFTSWPIMAMMHHFIVNKLCGISIDNYSLVGDDLVIRCSREGYEKYCAILKKIGMEINKNKTIESEPNDPDAHNIEFARNYIIKGIKLHPIEYGILLAWNDQKTSFESFFYAMRFTIRPYIIKQLAANCYINLTSENLLCLGYFFFKYKILEFKAEYSIESLLSPLIVPKWFKKISYAKVHESVLMEFERSAVAPKGENLLGNADVLQDDTISVFMHNFTSDLIVRTKLDAARARDLAERLTYLRFIDDAIGEMALQMSRRLFNVELIQYDLDEFGNPLISKKEKRVLIEIGNFFKFHSKSSPDKEKSLWIDLKYTEQT